MIFEFLLLPNPELLGEFQISRILGPLRQLPKRLEIRTIDHVLFLRPRGGPQLGIRALLRRQGTGDLIIHLHQ